MVRDMANKVLADRGGSPVGVGWPDKFLRRTPALKTRWTRRYDRQRALTEDPEKLCQWFSIVEATRAEHGILDEDTYNFDETGFMMGVVSSQLVVTGSHRRGRPKLVQPGGWTWVTVIQGIGAVGVAIPPYIIFPGKTHLCGWYQGNPPHPSWKIGVSDTGWTTNSHGIAWLRHFNQHTRTRTIGSRRLLLIDGHESHCSLEFQDFCKEANIITLCMPPHSSHLLQPLDVGCFGSLKRAYGNEIADMSRHASANITKNEFLDAFQKAYSKAMTPDNIKGSFRGAGLIPFNPEAVISRLSVRLRTPTPPRGSGPTQLHTPRNRLDLEAQSAYMLERMSRHQGSSPTSIMESMVRYTQGAQTMIVQSILVSSELHDLRKAAEAATSCWSRKRRSIQTGGALTIEEGARLAAETADCGKDGEEGPAKRVCAEGANAPQRRCGQCGVLGHNMRTCKENCEASRIPEQ